MRARGAGAVFKLAGVMLAGLLATLAVLTAGLLVWLRGSSGADFIWRQAAALLAERGLVLAADEFSGPLPGRLRVRNLSLGDADGPFLLVGGLDLDLRLASLLNGVLEARSLTVDRPRLLRRPAGKPSPPEAAPADLHLPLDIEVKKLRLTGGLATAEALAGFAPSWPAGRGLTLDLDSGAAGFSGAVLAVKARLRANDLTVEADGRVNLNDLAAQGRVRLHAADGGAWQLLLADLSPQIPLGELDLRVEGEYARSKTSVAVTLAGERLRWPSGRCPGPLLARLTVDGRPDDLTIDLKADSPALELAAGRLEKAALTLTASVKTAAAGRTAAGRLEAGAAAGFGGRLRLAADWEVIPPADGAGPRVRLAGLTADGAGLTASGELAAEFPPEARPLASGRLAAEVRDWAGLSALWGRSLQGGPTRLELDLADREGRQSAAARLNLAGLEAAGFTLGRMDLDLTADDLWGRPRVDLKLNAAPGRAGAFAWGGVRLTARNEGRPLDFNLTVEARQKKTPLAVLAGRYDPDQARVTVGALTVAVDQAGLKLAEPVVVELGDGFKIGALKADLAPAGRLEAKATVRPGDLDVSVRVEKLALADLAPLWARLPLADRDLAGTALLEARISGPRAAPRVAASAYLADGRYEDKSLGLLIGGLSLEAHLTPDGRLTALAAAADQRGGRLALEAGAEGLFGVAPTTVRLRGQAERFRPLHRDDVDLILTGLVKAAGPPEALTVRGELAVERGEVDIANLGGGSVTTLPISEKRASPSRNPAGGLVLDLTVDIPRRFFIRGRGLDSEWRGRLHIVGPAAAPALQGFLAPVRGRFDLLSKSFAFKEGEITFTGGPKINPSLNLALAYNSPALEALVKVSGPAAKPVLALSSRPPRPRDEILAQVLFGKSASELSRFETLQLANGVRELTDGGGFNLMEAARKKLGLDVLRFGGQEGQSRRADTDFAGGAYSQTSPGAAPEDGPSLEAGKYLTDKIYVGVEQGVAAGSTGVRVQIELRPNLTLEGSTSADSSEVGLGWKKDY